MDRKEQRRLYKYNFHRFKYKLCYLKVRTTEGGGVIHVLIRKDPNISKFDQKWCSQEWERIHGAKIVSFERIEVDPEQPLKDALNSAFYFCGNYFNQQPVVRQSSSYDWIFRGAAYAWCGRKEVLGIKKERKEFVYRTRQLHDEIVHDVPYHRVVKEKNILWIREGLIQKCCNSYVKRDSGSYRLECFFEICGVLQKTGFQRALELWKRLIFEPHINARQTKIIKFL